MRMNGIKAAALEVLGKILPSRVKNSLFHASFHLARPEFDRFAHEYSLAPSMAWGLIGLSKRGLSPKTIIDVGAFEGGWSRLARRTWPYSRIILIEPNLASRLSTTAKELDAIVLHELLGAVDGREVQFDVMGTGSSIMTERSPVARNRETRILRTMDALGLAIEPPVFLKIDAQGYELEILKGATKIIPAAEAILLEIATLEINEGAPLLYDALSFMKAVGFVAHDLLEIHRRPLDGALSQIDLLFVREGSILLSDKRFMA